MNSSDYRCPKLEIIELLCEGVLAASQGFDFPLNGWSDDNVDCGGDAF